MTKRWKWSDLSPAQRAAHNQRHRERYAADAAIRAKKAARQKNRSAKAKRKTAERQAWRKLRSAEIERRLSQDERISLKGAGLSIVSANELIAPFYKIRRGGKTIRETAADYAAGVEAQNTTTNSGQNHPTTTARGVRKTQM